MIHPLYAKLQGKHLMGKVKSVVSSTVCFSAVPLLKTNSAKDHTPLSDVCYCTSQMLATLLRQLKIASEFYILEKTTAGAIRIPCLHI